MLSSAAASYDAACLARHVYCTIILPLSAMFTAMIKELVFGFEIDGYTWWEMDHECAILVVTPQQPRRTYDDVAPPPPPPCRTGPNEAAE